LLAPRSSSARSRARRARRAAAAYPPEFLWTCTLVSTGEPCAMCTGTLYWVPHQPRTPKAAHGPPEDLSKKHGAATSARCKHMALTSAQTGVKFARPQCQFRCQGQASFQSQSRLAASPSDRRLCYGDRTDRRHVAQVFAGQFTALAEHFEAPSLRRH
jgi:hypothetical protein